MIFDKVSTIFVKINILTSGKSYYDTLSSKFLKLKFIALKYLNLQETVRKFTVMSICT